MIGFKNIAYDFKLKISINEITHLTYMFKTTNVPVVRAHVLQRYTQKLIENTVNGKFFDQTLAENASPNENVRVKLVPRNKICHSKSIV